ncbi:MAG: hypothetical protein R8P61_17380 [Bacteroidia bacterium]|nr:hypothetical protein [Bacteroidia bacterium]
MIHNISTQTTSSLSTLDYHLGSASDIYIAIHDQEGNMKRVLLDDHHTKGKHRLSWDPRTLRKGPYFIHIRMPNRRLVKKIDVA